MVEAATRDARGFLSKERTGMAKMAMPEPPLPAVPTDPVVPEVSWLH
jgi:hypothetical protein